MNPGHNRLPLCDLVLRRLLQSSRLQRRSLPRIRRVIQLGQPQLVSFRSMVPWTLAYRLRAQLIVVLVHSSICFVHQEKKTSLTRLAVSILRLLQPVFMPEQLRDPNFVSAFSRRCLVHRAVKTLDSRLGTTKSLSVFSSPQDYNRQNQKRPRQSCKWTREDGTLTPAGWMRSGQRRQPCSDWPRIRDQIRLWSAVWSINE